MPSYSPVYSSQFVVRHGTDPLVPFVVPAGFTAVIRDFTVYSSVAGLVAQTLIQDSAEAPALVVAQLSGIGVAEYAQWTGRVVVPAPGIITNAITDVGDAASIYVGGYLLRNTLT